MLKKCFYVFTSPAIYCYAYADDTYGNVCVVYAVNNLFLCISARRVQN
jgi:hypothetical protein